MLPARNAQAQTRNQQQQPEKKKSAYASSGVDIDAKMTGLQSIKSMVAATATAGSIGGIGHFGGLFSSPGKDTLLIGSTDGVGTKLKVASMAKRHTTVGEDLVNHCVNDILVQGAEPLFFLDYVGTSHFDERIFKDVVSGLCRACRANGCALLGGETAELPGLYPKGEYDLVGTIVGAVQRKKLITGDAIQPGDMIIGLASGGLQTNGFTLARKILFDQCGLTINDFIPGTRLRISDALLATHRSFLRPVQAVMRKVKIHGMAHITGGGFQDNIPRVLPKGCGAAIDRLAWQAPPIFTFMEKMGRVDHDEMYRVFNMGVGFVIIVSAKDAKKTLAALEEARTTAYLIGTIRKGKHDVVFRDGKLDDLVAAAKSI
ncbi:MAG: phosphoribosylformylglycinamidine cyclo-ligase [Kiritimatiellae bacterium]|nr:phosphoribosylformylglycinamidine cyclo-ligase [Kiritimatiellia bacterium]